MSLGTRMYVFHFRYFLLQVWDVNSSLPGSPLYCLRISAFFTVPVM